MEIFGPVIQGEGIMAGQQTLFVRFGGCDYRCSWCDSLHSVLPDLVKRDRTFMNPDEIVKKLLSLVGGKASGYSVTLSGGNPAMHDLQVLVRELRMHGFIIACETQGTIWPAWFCDLDVLTLSPKPPSSGNTTDVGDAFVAQMNQMDEDVEVCVKVVVFTEDDFFYARDAYHVLNEQLDDFTFYLQPGTPVDTNGLTDIQGTVLERTAKIIDMLVADGSMPTARVLPQVHALIYGHERGR